jgi:nucleoside-diphosphate kinase
MVERTLAIIKPDAVRAGVAGEIIAQIQQAGFRILGMKLIRLNEDQAGAFYAVHRERPFYRELVRYMSSGPVVPMALEKVNAVADFRTLIGATDPAEAAEGTIRKRFGRSKGENAIHGSDSPENARAEIAFFFAETELVG